MKNLQAVLEVEGKQRQGQIQKMEQQMRSRIQRLKEEHDGAVRGAQEFFCAAETKLLEEQKLLKVRRSHTSTHSAPPAAPHSRSELARL